MSISSLAGLPAPTEALINPDLLIALYHDRIPDCAVANQLVSFGTSGHRGTPKDSTFTREHILAITQAICDYRSKNEITGPVFVGRDTHAVSSPAQETCLEVLAANGVQTIIQVGDHPSPTPVISHAIVVYNRGRTSNIADGIIITPSHNPPADGGFKYNPTNGGPADTDITKWIQDRANNLLRDGNREVRQIPYLRALSAETTQPTDLITPYVSDLRHVIDMDVIRNAKLKIGVDPLGGASLPYWQPIAEMYGLDLTIVNRHLDPTFQFMTLDHDGQIRMDCSSPYAMASLVKMKDQFQLAFATDPDADRHGIVVPGMGLMNPNHYLAVAIDYLLGHRPDWPTTAGIGKTLVSSSLIDRVVASHGRRLVEVPVGFKWFAPGLADGTICFGGEESAGASFLRHDGTAWTTDKDGLLLCLLAAEITAKTGKHPGEHFMRLAGQFGMPEYTRIDAPASTEQKARLAKLTPADVTATDLAGETITAKLTRASGNNAPIGGLKVVSEGGWFAARPSGTENIYKVYAESIRSKKHLNRIVIEAQQIVAAALAH